VAGYAEIGRSQKEGEIKPVETAVKHWKGGVCMSWLKLLGILLGPLVALALLVSCDKTTEISSVVNQALTRQPPVTQPLAFDHAAHIKAEDMDCKDCHKFASKSPYATLPLLKDCKDCHSEAQGKSPEEPKVREYLDSNKEIPWITVNRLPGHVYFSHQAHVGFAEMKCWDCHRDMRKVSKPVSTSDIGYLSMSKCMACHQEKKVNDACTTCHK